MSLDLYRQDQQDLLDIARLNPLEALPPTFSEAFDVAVDENRQFAASSAELRNRYVTWQQSLDAFEDATGETLPNPEAVPAGSNREAVLRHIRTRFDQIGKERPDLGLAFPEEGAIAASAVGIARGARQRRTELEGGFQTFGSSAGFLVGDLWGAATDPVNAASMLFGAGAASGILRTALIEGAIGLTSQAAIEAGTAGFKAEVDPSYGLPDALGNIAVAGAGGAVISGGVAAAGRGVRALIDQYRRVRGNSATRRERDALNVLEREAEIDEANPLSGIEGEASHREALRAAGEAIEAGRPVEVGDLVSAVPQPRSGRVYTFAGRAVDIEYRVVEADSLIASHGADGTVNPAYPADLQPRDRSRVILKADGSA
jgi:hypothetical protein